MSKTTIPLVLLIFLTGIFSINGEDEKVEVTAEPTATSRGAIGQGFEIHKMDLLTKQFKATGATIFEDLSLKECTESDKIGIIKKDDFYYSSTKKLYEEVASKTNVDAKLTGAYTLGASVGAVTNNLASSEEEVQGFSLDLKSYGLSTEMKKDCIKDQPLSKKLLKDFEDLDEEITKPWRKLSWSKYEAFIKNYGTHFVVESIAGASIYQYVFAKSKKKFSQKDFKTEACLSLAGPTQAGEAEISACSEVSKKDKKNSKSKEMIKKLVIRGGSSETRADLSGELSADQINEFLKEGASDPEPIEYKFHSLLELLKTRYAGKENFAKALNLDQFYRGFLHYGCKNLLVQDADGKDIEMQKFDFGKDHETKTPVYECKVYSEGCHNDEDCHYRNAFWCECGGQHTKAKSCLRHKETELVSGDKKKEVYVNSVPGWGWHGCELSGLSCYCSDESKNWQTTWSGEKDDKPLRDYHKAMMAMRRRDEAMKRHHRKHHKTNSHKAKEWFKKLIRKKHL